MERVTEMSRDLLAKQRARRPLLASLVTLSYARFGVTLIRPDPSGNLFLSDRPPYRLASASPT